MMKNEGGFTLLELLIAMVLSMLVLVIVGGAVKLGLRSVRSGQRSADFEERLRSVCNILDSQVQDMVALAPTEERNYSFSGDANEMQFASVYSIWGDKRGCVFVKYKVEPGEDGKEELSEEETVTGTDMKKQTVLLPSADSISFEYFMRELKGEQGRWVDSTETDWTAASAQGGQPGEEVLMVRINFVDGPRRVHMTIPVNVRQS